jgi:hypothetical protein
VPGEQVPPHTPLMQAFVQVDVSWKVPVLSQVRTVLWSASHAVAPGEHMPPQALPTQAFVQVIVWATPPGLHVCNVLWSGRQVTAPGAQAVHTPATHATVHAAPLGI